MHFHMAMMDAAGRGGEAGGGNHVHGMWALRVGGSWGRAGGAIPRARAENGPCAGTAYGARRCRGVHVLDVDLAVGSPRADFPARVVPVDPRTEAEATETSRAR